MLSSHDQQDTECFFFFLVAMHKNQILSMLHCATLQSASFQDVHGTSNCSVKMASEKKSS